MKALSLWQPWASLIMWGEKEYETRSWPAPRGLIGQDIVIHAGKRPASWLDIPDVDVFKWALHKHGVSSEFGGMVYGAALGIVRLEGCYRTEELGGLRTIEYSFGDYAPGRYGWKLADVRPFVKPVPFRGAQGLFTYVPPP